MRRWQQDFSYAFRALRRAPGYTTIAVISLTLGIGFNAAIFSLSEAVSFRSWPAREPTRVARVIAKTHHGEEREFSYPEYRDVAAQSSQLSGVLAYARHGRFIGRPSEARFILVDMVSPNYFSVLGVPPAAGLSFDDRPRVAGEGPRVIISYTVWQRDFAGDRSLLGKPIFMSGRSYTLIGVAARDFRGLEKLVPTDAWIPAADENQQLETQQRDWREFELIARLRDGATADQARAELSVIASRFAAAYPETEKDRGIALITEKERLRQELPMALVCMAGVGLVLLAACANVAALNLARAEARKKEIAVRRALGASPSHLLRLFGAEGLLLASAGAVIGIILTEWLIRAQSVFMPPAMAELRADMRIDMVVLLFTLAITLGAAMISSLAPLLEGRKVVIVAALKGDEHSGGRRITLRTSLVTAQIAVAMVLLCTGGLLARSLWFSARIHAGFGTGKNLLFVTLAPYTAEYDGARTVPLMEQLADKAAALPGVKRATFAQRALLSGSGGGATIKVSIPGSERRLDIKCNAVAPGYFQTVGTRILEGRGFSVADGPANARVIVVSQTMAQRYWPDSEAIGRHIAVNGKDSEIVGVAEDAKINDIHETPEPYLYAPFAQLPGSEATLILETTRSSKAAAGAFRQLVSSTDKVVPILEVLTVSQLMHFALWQERIAAGLAAALSFAGVLLAMVGLYGVIAYYVNRRTREIGVRIALGAQLAQVRWMVLGYAGRMALAGVVIGLAAAVAAGRLLASFLYGVQPADPITLSGACALVTMIAFSAAIVPARRACRIDPIAALRRE